MLGVCGTFQTSLKIAQNHVGAIKGRKTIKYVLLKLNSLQSLNRFAFFVCSYETFVFKELTGMWKIINHKIFTRRDTSFLTKGLNPESICRQSRLKCLKFTTKFPPNIISYIKDVLLLQESL